MQYPIIATSFSISLLCLACSDAGIEMSGAAAETTIENQAPLASTQRAPVARVQLSPDHFIEFYELEPGHVAIYEQGSERDRPLDNTTWNNAPLVDIHEFVLPNDAVSETLYEAEQRRMTRFDESAKPSPVTGFHLAEAPESPAIRGTGETGSRSPELSGMRFAPGDPTTEWWHREFCGTSDVDSAWCPTDVRWATSGWRHTMYYEATAMAASSTSDAYFMVEEYRSGSWRVVHDQRLPPRSWQKWLSHGEGTFRSSVQGWGQDERVNFAERFRHSITTFKHVNFNPRSAEWQFNNDIQGVTHDGRFWYFTRTKYGISSPQNGVIAKSYIHALDTEPWIQYSEPRSWVDAGYPHFGDLTRRGEHLYIAMDGPGGCAVGVWWTDIRYYFGYGKVPGLRSCGWIAYNSRDNLFYTYDGTRTLKRYDITLDGADVIVSEKLPSIRLSVSLSHIQGGEFSDRGILYVVTGYKEPRMVVYGIDIFNGFVYKRFAYTGGLWQSWEAEGLTVGALNFPGLKGHLHVQLLENDWDNDDFSFAHLTAVDPSRL